MSVSQENITVAPLVLLSVLDHYKRTNTPEGKRVVGVILGSTSKSTIHVTNSFALPFEEDEKNSDVWFLDHNYIENMNDMCKKINAKEKIVGWYHSGPKLKASDLKINEIFKKYTSYNIFNSNTGSYSTTSNPLLLIVDVKQEGVGLATNAYISVEQVKDDGSSTERTFIHLPCSIEAEEAEEIGVEHLLKDVRDQAAGGLSIRLTAQLRSLKGLQQKLQHITNYLTKVSNNELPINHTILGKLQDVFNLLPNLGSPDDDELSATSANKAEVIRSSNSLQKALTVKTNDELMIIYISNLVRSIIAFDNLIENKIQNQKMHEKLSSTEKKTGDEEEHKEGDENSEENNRKETENSKPTSDK
ncbi:hypothetical protein TPHA_0D01500 [Tetrapisispora phaffii CBS 4417]|uniref:MPN domain-containing protein n=1 Tax=Tetrapisispora phaffii (strain ATCC 24235 / CBS 4417 / NBRC 1672 / NRRL Y-8282 / UCD 70-5) TaxID=1071381 RepID=G8BSG9_TETPH|nr:hypothetical protein TPHA_0D01500 [Tetrapisispora phaffii CBS 4417]CCE62790.1 hypothetical protein TPHA_0D01500 [Tetrapisispora phaffii CBS 4417]